MPRSFDESLLVWYQTHQRDLPWRRAADDAYAVWISEIMLQQTTVAAVIGFYERWMERFPTLLSVAEAPLDEILRYWAGLGYYNRARNIKRAAEMAVRDCAGRLPETVDELLKLPGIGRYTAGAISSIAYQRDAAILDANVTRVLCRLEGIEAEDVKSGAVQSTLWSLAQAAIPRGQAREFNQALMELGALVCSPRDPNCPACPVSRWCAAEKTGEPERFPAPARAKKWHAARHVAVAVMRGDRLLIVKRPEAGVWAGLWELPRVVAQDGEPLDVCAVRSVQENAGILIKDIRSFGTVRHVVMSTKIVLTGYAADPLNPGEARPIGAAEIAWVCPEQLGRYAISSPQRCLIGLWMSSRDQPVLSFDENK